MESLHAPLLSTFASSSLHLASGSFVALGIVLIFSHIIGVEFRPLLDKNSDPTVAHSCEKSQQEGLIGSRQTQGNQRRVALPGSSQVPLIFFLLFSTLLFFCIFVTRCSQWAAPDIASRELYVRSFVVSAAPASPACNRERQVLTARQGRISDGPGKYRNNSHCEWLIKALPQSLLATNLTLSPSYPYDTEGSNSSANRNNYQRMFITLTITSLHTECSFDHVFVYDGDSYSAPLLASLSGDHSKQSSLTQLTAQSGAMLILFYSDTNYVLEGFSANYSIDRCPRNCSDRGICTVFGECRCYTGFVGYACERELCPFNCSNGSSVSGKNQMSSSSRLLPQLIPQGTCSIDGCICSPGFSGRSCSLPYTSADPLQVGWHLLSAEGDGNYDVGLHTGVGRGLDEKQSLQNVTDLNTDSVSESKNDPRFNLDNTETDNKSSSLNSNGGINSRSWFRPRAGHAAAYQPFTEVLYTFGGRNFGEVFGDFLAYDFRTSRWRTLVNRLMPTARWGHAMSHHADVLVMFGGELASGALTNELWVYNIPHKRWSLELADPSGVEAPRLAFHTLTLIEQKIFIIFGGRAEGGRFSDSIYKMSLAGPAARWELVKPSAGHPIRVVGHTATFHAESRSILVYGGVVADMARFSKLSPNLYAFNVEKRHWTQIHFPVGSVGSSGAKILSPHSVRGHFLYSHHHNQRSGQPLERAFHTATIAGNYLVVFGGYMHRHNVEEKCYDDSIYLFHLKCYKWVSYETLTSSGNTVRKQRRRPYGTGVFSHAMALRAGSTLLILGGYSGYLRGDLRALQLPDTITHVAAETAAQLCGFHNFSETACKENPACGWCSNLSMCMDRNKKADCGTLFSVGSCPSLCQALHDCQSCMAWGEGQEITNHVMVDAGGFMPRSCGWCVSSSQCHSLNDPPLLCRTSENKTEGTAEGYWGNHGYVVTNLPECRSHNYKPGLTFVQFNTPVNMSLPDEVYMINSSAARIVFPWNSIPKEKAGGLARIKGYLHPTGVALDAANSPKIYIRSGFNSELSLSLDDKEANLELVARHNAHSLNLTEALRPSGGKLMPIVGKGARYLLNVDIKLSCENARQTRSNTCENFSEIKWCPQHRPCLHHALIPIKYLEPYKNGTDCKKRISCLACLVDAACGWCHSQGVCVSRSGEHDECPAVRDGELLVLEPEQCINCSYHIYCETCLADQNCEWISEDVTCARRGKNKVALTNRRRCPVPCHKRKGCQSCLGDPGRCAWCHQTQQCFLFSTYITSFMYGGCREWADEDLPAIVQGGNTRKGPLQCPDCSRHIDCKSCLSQLGCGWCGDIDNPNIGVCTGGDFASPFNSSCTDIVRQNLITILNEQPAFWSYERCPNVDECRLRLAECHHNATCQDTDESYTCVCNKGFKGDGKKECIKTCKEDCNHGKCSEAPEYICICEIGWTGQFCDIDCGCNFHSTCIGGVGECDECLHHTSGPRCNRCMKGAFGNATEKEGCTPCECNGHGDPEKNFCDPVSGDCHCIHNTESRRCERCSYGFYGNPRNNGVCFKSCTDYKPVLVDHFGAIGSKRNSPLFPQHCLWIIQGQQHSIIQLMIQKSLYIKCPENHIYVYEGLFSISTPGQLLGAYCGTQRNKPIIVTSKTNQLSVYFRRANAVEGFNATFRQLSCPEGCTAKRRVCKDGLCVCRPGFGGSNCDIKLCSKNCSTDTSGRSHTTNAPGICDSAYSLCRCNGYFGGDACDINLSSSASITWTLLYDTQRLFSSDSLQAFSTIAFSAAADFTLDTPPDIHFGHSLLASEPDGQLWLFGGVSQMDQDTNRLYQYDRHFGRWKKVNVSAHDETKVPAPRRYHCATIVGADIYIYGGMNKQFAAIGDFWKFATEYRTWTTISTNPDVPPLVGCTLTNIHNQFLLMVGGYSPDSGFQDKTYIYTIQDTTFKIFNTTGASPEGIYGHTADYHAPTDCVYVFGGILYQAGGPSVSPTLFALHVGLRTWTRLPPDERVAPLSKVAPRYLHSSAIIGDLMFIIGGRNLSTEATLDAYIYHISCNSWIPLESYYVRVNGTPPSAISSASAVSLGSDVYLYGGSPNEPHGSLYKISFPEDVCSLYHNTRMGCLDNPGCTYCSISSAPPLQKSKQFCFKNGNAPSLCDAKFPGVTLHTGRSCSVEWLQNRSCHQYENCVDCLAQWPVARTPTSSRVVNAISGGLLPAVCQWCPDCSQGRCLPVTGSCPTQASIDCQFAPVVIVGGSPENLNSPPVHSIFNQQVIRDAVELHSHTISSENSNKDIHYGSNEDAFLGHIDDALGGKRDSLGDPNVRSNFNDEANLPIRSGTPTAVVERAGRCPQRSCVASECERCRDLGSCMWTRQVSRSGELRHLVSHTPAYNWTCVRRSVKELVRHPVESNPPRACPQRCTVHANCTTCLDSTGSEGGSHQCWWASQLSQCLSPSFALLRCEGGACGALLRSPIGVDMNSHGFLTLPLPPSRSSTERLAAASSSSWPWLLLSAPPPSAQLQLPSTLILSSMYICSPGCHEHTQAKLCLADPRCGWCALLSGNGHGVCMEGGAEGPTGGSSCQNGTVLLHGHPPPHFHYSSAEGAVSRQSITTHYQTSRISDSRVGSTATDQQPNINGNTTTYGASSGGGVGWYYFKRPMENECNNGHHDCDSERERCIDRDDGYECICAEGYSNADSTTLVKDGTSANFSTNATSRIILSEVLDPTIRRSAGVQHFAQLSATTDPSLSTAKTCSPVCRQGCLRGACVKPDECKCDFGFVGANCSTPCNCNGHSDCAGPDKLAECTECRNNTQGPQCGQCMPGFVGNPTNGGKCISCFDYCHRHSIYCIDEHLLSSLNEATKADFDKLLKIGLSHPGPLESAICLNCSNNTIGSTCDTCEDGYFIRDGDVQNGCRPCECHGHGEMCDKFSGENCLCRNNTETDRSCSSASRNRHPSCWSQQCAKCKDNFQGVPVNGHQCYRHMRLDQEYCLGPDNLGECNHSQENYSLPPLTQGRTLFFVVQPRYMNVNIRIVIDIFMGEVELYFAAKQDTFVVSYNKSTGFHQVSVDPRYDVVYEERVSSISSKNGSIATIKFLKPPTARRHREVLRTNSVQRESSIFAKYPNAPLEVTGSTRPSLRLIKKEARSLTTYVQVQKAHHFLSITSLRSRLVLTVPQDVYDLRSTRLYIVVTGVARETNGTLLFRQDQTRIDLFVFFSVFFACFFLFLSMCVIVWKVKQNFDLRRARRLQAAEMQHMANRPFAQVFTTVYPMECENGGDLFLDVINRELRSQQCQHAAQNQELASFSFTELPPLTCPSGRSGTSHETRQSKTALRKLPTTGSGSNGGGMASYYSRSQVHLAPPVMRSSGGGKSLAPRRAFGFDWPASPGGVPRPVSIEPTADSQAAVATLLIQLPGGNSAPVHLGIGSALVATRGSLSSLC